MQAIIQPCIEYGILSRPRRKHKSIATRSPHKSVIPYASIQQVVSSPTAQAIAPCFPKERVTAGSRQQRVAAGTGEFARYVEGEAAALPAGEAEFMVEVDAFGRALALVEVIHDGAVVAEQRIEDGRSAARVVLPLPLPEQGSSYAYARVTCADGELMWSSPVRLFAPGAWPGPDGPDGAEVKERVGDVWGLDTDPLRERMRARGDGQ